MVEIISMEYNVGFAKGNNLGYTIAKYKYNSDYIIILNSDVYIQSLNFINQINQLYIKYSYDILGPKISNLDGCDQNPIEYVHDSSRKINNTLILNLIRFLYYFSNLYKEKDKTEKKTVAIDMVNVPLHGSCLIYSRNILNNRSLHFIQIRFYTEKKIFYFT